MAKLELDNVKLSKSIASDKCEKLSSSVIKPGSPTPSSRTVSSTNSIFHTEAFKSHDSGSSTASNSDVEELEHDLTHSHQGSSSSQPSRPANDLLSTDGILIGMQENDSFTHANGTKIAFNNSSKIQIGDKLFYGPVTIKQQFMLDDQNQWISRANLENFPIENGLINKGFDGSQNIANGSPIQSDVKTVGDTNSSAFRIKNISVKRKTIFLAALSTIFVVTTLVLLSFYLFNSEKLHKKGDVSDGDDSRKNIAINSTIDSDLISVKVLRLISRDEWLAQPPNVELASLRLPINRVIITHTATESCETQAACTLRVRLIQTFHMESKNWDDIGYNFIVGGDGAVYEGRGWDKQGAHTKGYNSGSIGIAYIGTFNKILPSLRQLNAGFLIMQEGVKFGKLTSDYKIYAHRQLIATESPGAKFFDLIKTWPHWTNKAPELL